MKIGSEFRVESVSPLDEQGNEHVTLAAVNAGTSGDVSFAKDEPHGIVKLSVTNPAVIGKFKEGETVYVTIETA